MKWGLKWRKTRKGKPLAYVETRSLPMSYQEWSTQIDATTRSAAHRDAWESMTLTMAALACGLTIGALCTIVLWVCFTSIG